MATSYSATERNTTDREGIYGILAGKLFDSVEQRMRNDQVIMIDRELGVVTDVIDLDEYRRFGLLDVEFLDFGQWTIVPGLVDAHVHMFLHAYSGTSWNDQVTKESLVERAIRATVHAQKTLMAGFTTVRDLGTEGAFDADISLRKCLSGREPIIPGPRYYCANRAIVTTGAYGPRSTLFPSRDGVEGVLGAEAADGIDACVREVRRQVGTGADWIKIYADYRIRAQIGELSPSLGSKSISTFGRRELEAMITTAHNLGVKVAAHANSGAAIENLLDLGVNSIEHGAEMFDSEDPNVDIIRKLGAAKRTTKWVPTLAAYHAMQRTQKVQGKSVWERARDTFVKAVIEEGLENVACGGDTGVFDHGENAMELILMRQLGAPWEKILSWATLGGWECVRGIEWEGELGRKRIRDLEENPGGAGGIDRDVPFGAINRGWAADLVGIEGNLTGSPDEFELAVTKGIKFVMKSGKIVKWVN